MVGISHLNCVIVVCVELAAAAKSLHSSKLSIFSFSWIFFPFAEIVRPTIVVIFDSIAIIYIFFKPQIWLFGCMCVFPGLFRIIIRWTQVYHLNPIYIIIIITTTAAFFCCLMFVYIFLGVNCREYLEFKTEIQDSGIEQCSIYRQQSWYRYM